MCPTYDVYKYKERLLKHESELALELSMTDI